MDLRVPRPNIEQQQPRVGEAAGGLAAAEPGGVRGALRPGAPRARARQRADLVASYI